jgi:HAD superfamily hydrolase (TIGR01509 family)
MRSSGLVLDFDGTILDTERSVFQAWAERWEGLGKLLDGGQCQRQLGRDDRRDPGEELEARLGRSLDPADLAWRRQRRDELLAREQPRHGVLSWLEAAERLGVPVGVASSSPVKWVSGQLERLGLRDRFACLVCRDSTVPAKPDPTSYRLACERLGADVTMSVAVDDSPPGVAAAVSAGLFTIAVPHPLTADLDLTAADLVVRSLEALSLSDGLDRARSRVEEAVGEGG